MHVEILNGHLAQDAARIIRTVQVASASCSTVPPGDWTVVLLLAEPEEVMRLHGEFFSDPSDTDVMSFPSGDELTQASGHLGDIAISVNMAAIQAAEAGHSLDREIVFLALHGLLHLTGWNDETEEQRNTMIAQQNAMLAAAELSLEQPL